MAEGDVLSQLNSNHRNDSSTENIVENGFQEEPDFSDPEDYDDDVSDSGKPSPLIVARRNVLPVGMNFSHIHVAFEQYVY